MIHLDRLLNWRYFFFLFGAFTVLPGLLLSQVHDEDREHFIFERFSFKEGLSIDNIFDLAIDHKGFLWISTADGLNRYDGKGFTKFYNNSQYDYQPDIAAIGDLFVDASGEIWQTAFAEQVKSFNIYDPDTGVFELISQLESSPGSDGHGALRTVVQGGDGVFWLGSSTGLHRYDPDSKSLKTLWPTESKPVNSSRSIQPRSIFVDSRNTVWLATAYNGLVVYDSDNDELETFASFETESGSLQTPNISSVGEDEEGKIWIATFNKGIVRYDRENNSFSRFPIVSTTDGQSLLDYRMRCVYRDRNGKMWFGTVYHGIQYYNRKEKALEAFDVLIPGVPKNNIDVRRIIEDENRILWVGTSGHGLIKVTRLNSGVERIFISEGEAHSAALNHVRYLGSDRHNNAWLGTRFTGLFVVNQDKKLIAHYTHDPNDERSIPSDVIDYIMTDDTGQMWFGTSKGVCRFVESTGDFERMEPPPEPGAHPRDLITRSMGPDYTGNVWWATDKKVYKYNISTGVLTEHSEKFRRQMEMRIHGLWGDAKGRLWLGTANGLFIYYQDQDRFEYYAYDPMDPNALQSPKMNQIYTDSRGRVWITTSNGFSAFREDTKDFTTYFARDGLPTNIVRKVIEDAYGQIWVVTENGIARYDPELDKFDSVQDINLTSNDRFNNVHPTPTGEILMASKRGLLSYTPEDPVLRKANASIPKFAITTVNSFENSLLRAPHSGTDRSFELSYDENRLTFEFALLDFVNPNQNFYSYILEGLDKDWVLSDRKSDVTYTNVPPGEYTFKARGKNSTGVWSDIHSIQVSITPPFWATWQFRSLTGLFVIGLIVTAHQVITRNIRRRNETLNRYNSSLEDQIERRKATEQALLRAKEEAEEASEAKSRFLANMSHEIRTPLNAIMGLSELITLKIDEEASTQYADTILSSSRHLLGIINDVLDFARIEADKLVLKEADYNPFDMVENVVKVFSAEAFRKDLDFVIRIDPNMPVVMHGDEGRVKQILINLLSNAIKFTHQGRVELGVRALDEGEIMQVEFTVLDTGIGIPEDQQEAVFDMFEQADMSMTREYEGTGIGLAIVRRLVSIMKGKVELQSEVDKGTVFKVTIQRGEIDLKDWEKKKLEHDMSGSAVLLCSSNEARINAMLPWLEVWGARTIQAKTVDRTAVDKWGDYDIAIVDESLSREYKELGIPHYKAPEIFVLPNGSGCHRTKSEFSIEAPVTPLRMKEYLIAVSNVLVPLKTKKVSKDSDSVPTHAEPSKPLAHGGERKVLIVEDNQNSRLSLEKMLSHLGYRTKFAIHGEEGLAFLESESFDLVLMDLQMPRMDGYTLARRIRNDSKINHNLDTPLIAVTAHAMDGERERCLEAGFNDFLMKPVSISDLSEVLERSSHARSS